MSSLFVSVLCFIFELLSSFLMMVTLDLWSTSIRNFEGVAYIMILSISILPLFVYIPILILFLICNPQLWMNNNWWKKTFYFVIRGPALCMGFVQALNYLLVVGVTPEIAPSIQALLALVPFVITVVLQLCYLRKFPSFCSWFFFVMLGSAIMSTFFNFFAALPIFFDGFSSPMGRSPVVYIMLCFVLIIGNGVTPIINVLYSQYLEKSIGLEEEKSFLKIGTYTQKSVHTVIDGLLSTTIVGIYTLFFVIFLPIIISLCGIPVFGLNILHPQTWLTDVQQCLFTTHLCNDFSFGFLIIFSFAVSFYNPTQTIVSGLESPLWTLLIGSISSLLMVICFSTDGVVGFLWNEGPEFLSTFGEDPSWWIFWMIGFMFVALICTFIYTFSKCIWIKKKSVDELYYPPNHWLYRFCDTTLSCNLWIKNIVCCVKDENFDDENRSLL